jgi:hypothetical protein
VVSANASSTVIGRAIEDAISAALRVVTSMVVPWG